MSTDKPLKGEERKIVSTRLYRTEFANLIKICQRENKSVNAKLRELVQEEVNDKLGGLLNG